MRFRLRMKAVWCLLVGMLACCVLLWISPFPEEWKPLQNLAAILQAFMTGLVAAQWLPIWEPQPPDGSSERVAPSAR